MTRGWKITLSILVAIPTLLVLAIAILFFSILRSPNQTLHLGAASTSIKQAGSQAKDRATEKTSISLMKFLGMWHPGMSQTEATMREDFLFKFPLGTKETAIRNALAKSGIVFDQANYYHPPENGNNALIRIGDTHESFTLVIAEHHISLHFDNEMRLREVHTKIGLTGP